MNEPLSDLELDALRELVSVGGAYAANALSGVLKGKAVTLDVPSARVLSLSALSESVEPGDALVIRLGVEGGLTAQMLLRLSSEDARLLAGWMLGSEGVAWPLPPDAFSAVSEAGNILGSACLTALGRMTGLKLLPTVPKLERVESRLRLTELLPLQSFEYAVMLEALLSTTALPPLRVQLLLFPDPRALPELFSRMGLREQQRAKG